MDDETTIVSSDEAKAEQEALKEAKADEIRETIITDLGLTDDDSELTNKLVERELDHRKKLSEAIGQKINWRTKAQTAKPAPAPKSETTPSLDQEAIRKQTEATVSAQFEQRDLDEMDYPDEIKAEIKRVAQITGVSVRKAAQDPYIQSKIAEVTAADRVIEAGIPRSPKAPTATTGTVPKFDMSTEEGRKKHDDWKKSRKQ